MRIAILSTNKLPRFLGDDHPTEGSLFAEDILLIEELSRIGVSAERVGWRAQNIDWSKFEAAVIRSTWDYIDDPDLFFATLKQIEDAGVRLINPVETVHWNSDKRYLKELAKRDLPVVPTHFLTGQSDISGLPDCFLNAERLVLKPTVGVGGFGVRIFRSPTELMAALPQFDGGSPLMVQPFLPSISSEGEWSFVFGAGELLYSVLKEPAAGDYRVQVMYGATTTEKTPAEEDRNAAIRVARNLPVTASVMRIDMARLPDGTLGLMEAELIEPQLYLFDVPEAAPKLAWAVKETLTSVR